MDSENLTLEVPNDFCEVWIKDNYLGLIRDVVAQASGQQLKIKLEVTNQPAPVVQAVSEPAPAPKPGMGHPSPISRIGTTSTAR